MSDLIDNHPELSNNSPELDIKNGELISRQKAKDAIDMALDPIDHVPSWVYDNLLNALNEVPSVNPTHPTLSNTLGALDCIDRNEAIKNLEQYKDLFSRDDGARERYILTRVIKELKAMPSVQPERMVLPEICILEGYDTVEDENGNRGFGVYIPSKKQIYVVGDVPQEIMLKALFHELTHWVQDISGRHFDEDEANLLAERVYEALSHDMRGEQNEL